MEDDMVDYIPVVSRRTKKQRKSAEKRRRRGTPAKSSVASGGALAKSSAASVKVLNDHPLCGIMEVERKIKSIYDRCYFKLQGCWQEGYKCFPVRFA
jgi:hypothetical protein